jgi:hypothetical protein
MQGLIFANYLSKNVILVNVLSRCKIYCDVCFATLASITFICDVYVDDQTLVDVYDGFEPLRYVKYSKLCGLGFWMSRCLLLQVKNLKNKISPP